MDREFVRINTTKCSSENYERNVSSASFRRIYTVNGLENA